MCSYLRQHAKRDFRRRCSRNPISWERIGDALNITGQAAGKRARAHRLAITPPTPMTPERYQQLVEEGILLAAQRGRSQRYIT